MDANKENNTIITIDNIEKIEKIEKPIEKNTVCKEYLCNRMIFSASIFIILFIIIIVIIITT